MSIHWKDWCWSWNSNTLATRWKELTHRKDPDSGKDWRQVDKGTTEDEMASPTLWSSIWARSGDGKGQGSLLCCRPWGHKESDMTEWLNNKNKGNGNSLQYSFLDNSMDRGAWQSSVPGITKGQGQTRLSDWVRSQISWE